METAGFEAHVVALAVRVKGDVTWAPFAGAATMMADVVPLAGVAAVVADVSVGTEHAASVMAAKLRRILMK